MQMVLQAVAANIVPLAYAIAVAGVVAALCFQRPEKAYAGKVVFGGLCVLLPALGCVAAGVLSAPPAWASFVQILLVVAGGCFLGKCGWRRTVLSVGCWAFVTYMLWMGLRALPCDAVALSFVRDKLLPAVALPCLLALLLSVKGPVRFLSAFFGVFLVLYIMESVGLAWESFDPQSTLPGWSRLLREVVLGVVELALMLWVFLGVLQAARRRAALVLALYALRTAYVVYGLAVLCA